MLRVGSFFTFIYVEGSFSRAVCVRWDPVLEETDLTSFHVSCGMGYLPTAAVPYRSGVPYRTAPCRAVPCRPYRRTVQPDRAVLCRRLLCVLHRANSALQSPRLSAFDAGRQACRHMRCMCACMPTGG